jgi:YHS domain-containing protein
MYTKWRRTIPPTKGIETMRTFIAIGLVLMTAILHGCGASDNTAPSAVEITPEPTHAAMDTAAPSAEPQVLEHAVDPATLGLMIDPVCKMSFEEYAVETTSEYGGKNYGFCSEFCKKNFAKDPDKILARLTEPPATP